jgi:AhpD family alkylhydroperoxidase
MSQEGSSNSFRLRTAGGLSEEKGDAMQPRIEYMNVAPNAMSPMLALEQYVRESGLDPSLLELIKLRASQINGCAYCIDMHTKDARARGESEQRLYAVAVWRETPFFTERERAALAWAEAVTQVSWQHVPEDVYQLARQHFDEKELVDLTMAIIAINGWNRLAISFRTVPGTYQPATEDRKVAAASRAPASALGQERDHARSH